MNLIFFATSFSTNNGGINSFNFSLLKDLSSEKQLKIYCIVNDNLETYLSYENIKIITSQGDYIKNQNFITKELPSSINSDSTYWIGHDSITGNSAVFFKEKLGGKSILFHHMDYSNYSHLKNNDNREKIIGQNSLIKKSDIVIAIGPRLFENAKRLRNSNETYEITPGIFDSIDKRTKNHSFRIVLAGRLDPSENTVKNTDIAIRSSAEFLSKNQKNKGSISIIGSSYHDIPKGIRSKYNHVAINCIPYTNDRAIYGQILSESDLLIMPSVKEGFGLVAWEAASIGLPTIVSKSSGYFEWLEKRNLEKYTSSISITGIAAFDSVNINKSIKNIFNSYESHQDNATQLKEKISSNTWKNCAAKFQDIIGIAKNIIQETSDENFPKSNALQKPTKNIFDNFEKIVSVTNKSRICEISTGESTNFSKGKRIKYELWFGPLNKIHYLFIHKSANISQTLDDFLEKINENKITITNLILIKSDKSKSPSINELKTKCITLEEYSVKDYIWNHCIDREFKEPSSSKIIRYYIEQNLISNNGEKISKTDFLKIIENDQESSAHLVIAPGGMGKTYLTRSIYNSIQEKAKSHQISILIEAEFIKKYIDSNGIGQIKIQSLYDLYDLYDLYIKSSRHELRYEKSIFELSVLSGSLLIIIDGLDELITKLQTNFNLNSFSQSIFDLSNSLSSGKIIITTRDSNILNEEFLLNYDFRKYELLGFTEDDLSLFISKKIQLPKDQKNLISSKFIKYLNSTQLHDNDQRISPFVADIVSDITIEEISAETNSFLINKDLTTLYESCNDPIDRVIHAIFIREIKRQKFEQLDTNLIMLIAEKFSSFGESIRIDNFINEIEIFYGNNKDEIFSKIAINPLFKHSGNYLSLKYDFLESYLRSIFTINNIKNKSITKESLSSTEKLNNKNSNEYSYITKYFRSNNNHNLIINYLSDLRKNLNKFDEPIKKEYAKKSISSLLKVYQESTSSSSSKMSLLIKEIFKTDGSSHPRIDNLYITGDFQKLDLSNITVSSSRLVDYKNICKCDVENSIFIDCIFDNCYEGIFLDQSFAKAEFEASCKLGDLEQHISKAKEKDETLEKNFETEYRKFLECFFENGSLFDPKAEWIMFSNKIPMLSLKNINKLIPRYLIIKSQKNKGTHYTLSPEFSEIAFTYIESGKKEKPLLEFVDFIKNK